MHGSALGTCSDAAFGDTGVVSGVAGACSCTYLAHHELESIVIVIVIYYCYYVAGAHLETRVLALLKKMQSANLMPPASQSKSKQSRLTAHLGPKSGPPPIPLSLCSSASQLAHAICLAYLLD